MAVGEAGMAGLLLLESGNEAVELDLFRIELLLGPCDEVAVDAVQFGDFKGEAAARLPEVQGVGGRERLSVKQHAAIDGFGHGGGPGLDVGVVRCDDAKALPVVEFFEEHFGQSTSEFRVAAGAELIE